MRFLHSAGPDTFSFRYDAAPSAILMPTWPRETTAAPMNEAAPGSETRHDAYRDAATGLAVTVTARAFAGFPAVEWVLELTNDGTNDTPIIEDLLPLDARLPLPAQERLRLHHPHGSLCQMDDFLPQVTELRPGAQVTVAPRGGRSSNGAFPFANLQAGSGGLIVAVGWSGQWAMTFSRDREGLHLTAGMERTRLRLHPGESVRTPRILLMEWEGDDVETGQNLLRQLLLAHYLPRLNEELVLPPVAQCLQGYFYLTGRAGEQYEQVALPKVAALGADAYWIDACWYGGQREWWQEVGSWTVNRTRFPNGLRPISDAARAAGMQFVLWFEPERVRPGSELHQQHPEFLLTAPDNPDNLLFNLGMPEARAYLTDLLSAAISEHGVDIYRQDFNFDPLPYWQAADPPDRAGITEIRYVTGLYELWDELRRRHPGLWIDNCASGGRRIDLETLSRSLPLWPSDFHDIVGLAYGRGLHVGDQCINAGLARWVPLFGGGVWNFTPYSTRSQLIGGFTFGFHIDAAHLPADDAAELTGSLDVMAKGVTLLDDAFPLADAAAAIAELHSIRPFLTGDFHELLPLTVTYHDWCGWQLHREDLAAGVAVLLRRHRSPFPTFDLNLKRIDPEVAYAVSISHGYTAEPDIRLRGAELARLTVTINETPGSVLVRYRRV